MFRPYSQNQMMLLPPSVADFLGIDHPVFLINDLVEKLNLALLEMRYGNMGQPAYQPRLMLKIILYGFTVGIFSARKLTRACRENLAFQYLTGGETPAFKTFIEFRQRHRDDMQEVFLQTVKLAQALGLKRLANVALDGTKIQANTSKHKAMSYDRMEKEEQRLKEEITALLKKAEEVDAQEDQEYGVNEDGYSLKDELARREDRLKKIEEAKSALEEREKKEHPGQPIESKKQISFADTEARCFTKKSDGTRYVYNPQVAVEMETQLIVENHIEDSVNDAGAVETTLANIEEGLDMNPEKLVADGGYGNTETVESCREHEVTPVCATTREKEPVDQKGKQILSSFAYDTQSNTFRCPHGVVFKFNGWTQGKERAIYRSMTECACKVKRSKKKGATLYVRKSHLAQRELQRILSTPENRELYRRRKSTVEPVIGQIKSGMGFRAFLYRGKKKVGSEWNVVCSAFNLRKIAALIKCGALSDPALSGVRHGFRKAEGSTCFSWGIAHCVRLFRSLINLTDGYVVPMAHCA